jgi:hypothetical protein
MDRFELPILNNLVAQVYLPAVVDDHFLSFSVQYCIMRGAFFIGFSLDDKPFFLSKVKMVVFIERSASLLKINLNIGSRKK